jgi:valyl-tRNA synthetase
MSAYDPKHTDKKWLSFWETHHLFKADAHSNKPPFSMVIPPPNVTGVLHMGHALVNTLQDVIARYKRLKGFEVLWVPGTDHAGIATQTVVERHLMATEKRRRNDYRKEDFIKEVWAWKEKSEKVILGQLKKLGCSCDFSRLCFTMDPQCNRAVRVMFKKLFDQGLIYRGDYLVNWDPVTQTALADDEVEYEEREGSLWTLHYPLDAGLPPVAVATTRPETLLGDTALAVNPKDTRYAHLIGKQARVPFVNRLIPIIADPFVDPAFGTGVVKVTPAHDPNDYKMGLNHHLPMINILHPDGLLNENAGPFAGLTREEGRKGVIEGLKAAGLLLKVERHLHRVGVSYRSKAVIEPLLSKQWFVKMSPFVQPLKDMVDTGAVKLIPNTWQSTYFHWINNLRDWCISRQLWWGHQIPVWYAIDDPSHVICHDGEGEPEEVKAHPDRWKQDPDVLDTWFSSALWPLSTLGWPDKTADFEKFYPTNVLITGHDILFFWVARMMLMGHYATGQAPFYETFLHGLIYGRSYWRENPEGGITYLAGEEKRALDLGQTPAKDVKSKWEKLSKSKGNVIDPLELIEDYGTDAVRMTLCYIANQTPQIDLDRRRFEEFKNFANKVWNGARFVLMNVEDLKDFSMPTHLELEDEWILSKLSSVIQTVNEAFDSYQFDTAAHTAYTFFWKEFCAYYVEMSKPALYGQDRAARIQKQKVLLHVLIAVVRLLHPMAPFITEELFESLKLKFEGATFEGILAPLQAQACSTALFPEPTVPFNARVEEQFCTLEKVIYSLRKIRGEMKIPPHMATDVYLAGPIDPRQAALISALVKTQALHVVEKLPDRPFAATDTVDGLFILIPLPPQLQAEEIARLEKEKGQLLTALSHLDKLLGNADFLAKAAPALIEKKKEERDQIHIRLSLIEKKLS